MISGKLRYIDYKLVYVIVINCLFYLINDKMYIVGIMFENLEIL